MRARIHRLGLRAERAIWRFSQSESGRATVVASALLAVGCGTVAFWAALTFAISRDKTAATVAGMAILAGLICAGIAYLVNTGDGD